LEGESFDTPFSPEVVKWKEIDLNLEDFPTPPPIRVAVVTEGKTSVTSSPSSLSPNAQPFPFSPRSIAPVSPVRNPSSPVQTPMARENPPKTRMEFTIASRYGPLVLPQPLNSLPTDGYLKKLPKFMGEGDITAEAHLESFYSFIDNHAIENEDVWMMIFVHSLDGEARKWFRALPPGSIDEIEA
jgi:hypothetical protein